MDNQNEDNKQYENNIPPQLDSEMIWVFYKQKYALLLVLIFGGSLMLAIQNPTLIIPIIFIFSILAFLLIQANDYYTIGYVFYRYFMSLYIEPLAYYKESKKEEKKRAKTERNKKSFRRKKRTEKKTKRTL